MSIKSSTFENNQCKKIKSSRKTFIAYTLLFNLKAQIMIKFSTLYPLFLVLIFFMLSFCTGSGTEIFTDESVEGPYISVEGEIRYLDLEGGNWILDSDSVRYHVINLPENFQSDGLVVKAELAKRPDVVTTCMCGEVAEVYKIEVVKE